MKNVLLVDTNFSSGPIYQYLVDSGYAVTVFGGNPQDALAKFLLTGSRKMINCFIVPVEAGSAKWQYSK